MSSELDRYTVPRLAAMAMLIGLSLLLGACSSESEPGVQEIQIAMTADAPIQTLFDYRLVQSTAGVKDWVLQSAEMKKFAGQREAQLLDVRVDFFQDGAHFSRLTSDSGSVQLQTQDVHTWGHVVVVTDDGRRLETEELLFDQKSGLVRNEVANRFVRGADVMTGIGLEATPDLEYIVIKRNVLVEVNDSAEATGRDGER